MRDFLGSSAVGGGDDRGMNELIAEISAQNGGVVGRRHLAGLGVDPAELTGLVRTGTLIVIRRGWYAAATARPEVVTAVQAGATLTCLSALALVPGIWIPPLPRRDHVRWPAHRHTSLRTQQGCRAHVSLGTSLRAVDPVRVALQCAVNCVDEDYYVVAVLDSLLRLPDPHTVAEVREVFDGAPRRIQRLLDDLDPAAQSGTESVTRHRLRSANIRVRSQVTIPGLGRVDLLVGDRLIIECDSDGFHNGAQRREDARRDRRATIGRYHVLRIDYADVMLDWDTVFADITDMVRSRRHIGAVRF